MTLEETEQCAIEYIRDYVGWEWDFEWSNSRRNLGTCYFNQQIIKLSKHYVPLMTDEEIIELIKHEVAHAIVGPKHGHDKTWKAKLISMGGTGERLYHNRDVIHAVKRYRAVCLSCGYTHYGNRRTSSACGACCRKHNDGKYSAKYKFDWQPND